MVKPNLLTPVLCAMAACGPGLRDGAYPGDERFVLPGTIENIVVQPNLSNKTLQLTVIWQVPEARTYDSETAFAPAPVAPVGAAPGARPDAPRPTSTTQREKGIDVAFPAPITLRIYDLPTDTADDEAEEAIGTVVVYYDTNGDGRYNEESETIACALHDHRIVYHRDPRQAPLQLLNSYLSNGAALTAPFVLAESFCLSRAQFLTVVPTRTVALTAGHPVSCDVP